MRNGAPNSVSRFVADDLAADVPARRGGRRSGSLGQRPQSQRTHSRAAKEHGQPKNQG